MNTTKTLSLLVGWKRFLKRPTLLFCTLVSSVFVGAAFLMGLHEQIDLIGTAISALIGDTSLSLAQLYHLNELGLALIFLTGIVALLAQLTKQVDAGIGWERYESEARVIAALQATFISIGPFGLLGLTGYRLFYGPSIFDARPLAITPEVGLTIVVLLSLVLGVMEGVHLAYARRIFDRVVGSTLLGALVLIVLVGGLALPAVSVQYDRIVAQQTRSRLALLPALEPLLEGDGPESLTLDEGQFAYRRIRSSWTWATVDVYEQDEHVLRLAIDRPTDSFVQVQTPYSAMAPDVVDRALDEFLKKHGDWSRGAHNTLRFHPSLASP